MWILKEKREIKLINLNKKEIASKYIKYKLAIKRFTRRIIKKLKIDMHFKRIKQKTSKKFKRKR